MTDTVETTESEQETKRIVAPKTIADLKDLTELGTTEATTSFANFMNKYLSAENEGQIDGFHITPEQAWTVIFAHRIWQQSEERKEEKEALKAAGEEEKERKRLEREEKKAQREKEREEKAAEAERKRQEREAKKAAKAEADNDLDGVDDEGEGEIGESKPTRRRRKAKPAAVEIDPEEAADESDEVAEDPAEGF